MECTLDHNGNREPMECVSLPAGTEYLVLEDPSPEREYTERDDEVLLSRCCSHLTCQNFVSRRLCRRLYRLVFVTGEPLPEDGSFLNCTLRSFFPGQEMKHCIVLNYRQRTKGGFCVCQVVFEIPDGVEFNSEDQMRLQTICTPKDEDEPILFSHSCCQEKRGLLDSVVNGFVRAGWTEQDGVGGRPMGERGQPPGALAALLGLSIVSVVGTTCGS